MKDGYATAAELPTAEQREAFARIYASLFKGGA